MNNINISTKSIQKTSSKGDGIRICIMRRIKPEFEFDMWIPPLSPSTELLKDYQEEKIDWEEFSNLFKKELKKQKKYLNFVMELSNKEKVTLLCWEETADKCHRKLVIEEIKKLSLKG